jgi:L-fuculose-phosphate aldolase
MAMHDSERAARQSLVDHCRAMSASGLSFNKSGNASVRWGKGLLVTPTGRPYDCLQAEEIVYLEADGTGPAGQLIPSSEWRIHRDILEAFPDANAVMHLHSPHATALACLGLDIPAFHYMVAVAGGDRIPCSPYATFGTADLSDNILQTLRGGFRACLMANHGLVAMGASLEEAYALAGEVENLARQYIIARSLGATQDLPRDEMERVLEKFKTYGQQRDNT